MLNNVTNRYTVRRALSKADVQSAHILRSKAFTAAGTQSADPFDAKCDVILIENSESNVLVASFRLLQLGSGCEISQSYSAQFYGLDNLGTLDGPALEVGRFCVDPALSDPEILRVAWAAIAQYVDENAVQLLFGCSSFHGTDATPYREVFALLNAKYLAPSRWQPQVKAPDVIRFPARTDINRKQAFTAMPPLLRSYLLMGGWVSDHAVIDQQMNTLHVFTGLEVNAIPEARKRLLRANALKIA